MAVRHYRTVVALLMYYCTTARWPGLWHCARPVSGYMGGCALTGGFQVSLSMDWSSSSLSVRPLELELTGLAALISFLRLNFSSSTVNFVLFSKKENRLRSATRHKTFFLNLICTFMASTFLAVVSKITSASSIFPTEDHKPPAA